MASSSQHRCVFVGNIPYDATEEQLIQICEEVGPVVSFRLVLDRETGKPKGYGFCEYKDEETALSARRNLQGYEINGRQLRVDFAENDKGADRNREQGRGGPGLASNTDAQKPSGILGSSATHQPLGIQLAATAASVMAGALGGVQTSSVAGFRSQPGPGNDPLTQYLAKMSRNQLHELMSEMKALTTQNKALASQLLQSNPQFAKALFQAQIMLGMVTPQMLQMPHIQQSGSSVLQPQVLDDGQPVRLPHNAPPALPRPQDGRMSTLPQNPLIPQHIPMQPRSELSQERQSQLLSQGTSSVKSGGPTVPPVQPQLLSNSFRPPIPPLATQGLPSVQPSLLQQPRPVPIPNAGHHSQSSFPNPSTQQPVLLQAPSSQNGSSNYPVMLGGLEPVSTESTLSTSHGYDPARGSRINKASSSITTFAEQAGMANEALGLTNRPSKLARLEDGIRAPQNTSSYTSVAASAPAQLFGAGVTSAGQTVSADGTQHSEKQMTQFLPEAEAALLQQVMSLTSEQLSSLPPEQRQQVIQLQQMLRS